MLIPLVVTGPHAEVGCVAEERTSSVLGAEVGTVDKCSVSICRRLLRSMKGDRIGPVKGLRWRQYFSPKDL
jgi:hypothetical protein